MGILTKEEKLYILATIKIRLEELHIVNPKITNSNIRLLLERELVLIEDIMNKLVINND